MRAEDDGLIRDIRQRLDKPVVLVGLMGVGKTRLGRLLAETLNAPFIDSDDEIETAAGMPITDIFEKFGEPYFRDGEARVIKRLLDGGVRIIATGGGAVMRPETMEAICEKGISIWIRAEMEVMLERVSRNNNRPVLHRGDPEEILKDLVEHRYPVYEQSNITIDSHNGPAEAILNIALTKLHSHLYM